MNRCLRDVSKDFLLLELRVNGRHGRLAQHPAIDSNQFMYLYFAIRFRARHTLPPVCASGRTRSSSLLTCKKQQLQRPGPRVMLLSSPDQAGIVVARDTVLFSMYYGILNHGVKWSVEKCHRP